MNRWAKNPRQIIVDNFPLFKPGTVLDLGGSDGANALYLARNGFTVTNVDKDKQAIADCLSTAAKEFLNVDGVVSNLNEYKIQKEYDNIITLFTLHFLSPKAAKGLINQMKSKTNVGGLNLVVAFTNKGEFDVSRGFYFNNDEILDIYDGWEILLYKKEVGATKSGLNQERLHFIARKAHT
ncbi:MAG: Tellurite resistance protein TehB [Candidatus Woesebacteria bacterium GW2011_GWA1_41_7]|uniref:Tellurite resistance protein TehB n=1 Tax=Candidatus Woesebacteria bacterium GW2011_GWA1_41_7 TaxID=1618556 RepID=A0A0G0ZT79_9BACT|nr:MAG: Tellurite resistance protein TehB [Candidatus Woesebacteria bacterium GW2011_GWA1_41_7]